MFFLKKHRLKPDSGQPLITLYANAGQFQSGYMTKGLAITSICNLNTLN